MGVVPLAIGTRSRPLAIAAVSVVAAKSPRVGAPGGGGTASESPRASDGHVR